MKERGLVRGKEMNVKGQVTIFIIVAIIIVVVGVLIYFFRPSIPGFNGGGEVTPESFIQNCLEDEVSLVVEKVSLQGGSLEPEHSFNFQGNELEYLCYTNEYYKNCVVQQPLLYKKVSEEIIKGIKEKENFCFNSLKSEYESQGYSVNIQKGVTNAQLLPGRILINFPGTITVSRNGATSTIDNLRIVLNNNLYEHVGIATSIVEYETVYGDSETTLYMNLYPDLKVEKLKQTDGTTVYILSNRDGKGKFQFASRSLAWPPGYGIA